MIRRRSSRIRRIRRPKFRKIIRRRVKGARSRRLAPRIRPVSTFKKSRGFSRKTTNAGRKLDLQMCMQSGRSMPDTSFCRLYYRGSGCITFGNLDAGGGANLAVAMDNTFRLNHLGGVVPPEALAIGSNHGFNGQYSYQNLWHTLYHRYSVLGSKTRFRLTPPAWPASLAPSYISSHSSVSGPLRANTVPFNAVHGFWYMRHHYWRRSKVPASGTPLPGFNVDGFKEIGHPMNNAINEVSLWANMRDFLADPTVTWQRDKLPKVHSIEATVQCPVGATGSNQGLMRPYLEGPGNIQPAMIPTLGQSSSFSYRMSFSNKPVLFRCTYSQKKHLGVEHPITEGEFYEFQDSNSTPSPPPKEELFSVRLGYIAFNDTGLVAYNVPMDRCTYRQLEAEIEYFVALKGPKHVPWTHVEQSEVLEGLDDVNARRFLASEEIESNVEEELNDDEVNQQSELETE